MDQFDPPTMGRLAGGQVTVDYATFYADDDDDDDGDNDDDADGLLRGLLGGCDSDDGGDGAGGERPSKVRADRELAVRRVLVAVARPACLPACLHCVWQLGC